MNRQLQIKICGLTDVEEALACVERGADAIGCVFYPKSPRYVSEAKARDIVQALPASAAGVGVFVNESYETIMRTVERCGLKAVQLHGQEQPDLVEKIRNKQLIVIKAIFAHGTPSFQDADQYPASAFLAECGKGPLPGGNALSWNWKLAQELVQKFPVILAGGLVPDNIAHAVLSCGPDAADVSSGVESAPGRKDIIKVEALMDALSQCPITWKLRRIF